MTRPAGPELLDVPVTGGVLRVARWGRAEPVVVAVHGVTANHRCWSPLAGALDGHGTLAAPDLRGRGASASITGPFGVDAHADDLVAVLDHIGASTATVVGHSMGGFVAVSCAARYPERIKRVVLVDGGLPLGVEAPAESTIDDLLHAVLGPALERLRRTFTDRASYHRFWRAHPAFHDPSDWTPEVEAYLDYDLVGEPPLLRSGVSLDAVRRDSQDTLGDSARHALERLDRPLVLLRAPAGMFGEPPGLYPDDLVAAARHYVRIDHAEVVEGTNHYTIVLGARGAAAVAAHCR